jgi:hypothetical protein
MASKGKTCCSQEDQQIYVLTLESISHATCHQPAQKIVGVFSSKAAAVVASGSVQTAYGEVGSAIVFGTTHEDNRDSPPDNDVLVQLGHEDTGEGDIERLIVDKFPVLGMPSLSPGSSSNKRRKVNHQSSSSKDDNDKNYSSDDDDDAHDDDNADSFIVL